MKCDGSPKSRTQGQAYLIIYGIEGNHSDVPADVYDKAFIFEDNKMVMETKLDINNKKIINVKSPTKDDNPVNLSYLKGLETFITGSYFPSFTKIERREYSINAIDVTNYNVYFGQILFFKLYLMIV